MIRYLYLFLSITFYGSNSVFPGLGPQKYCISEHKADCLPEMEILVNSLYSQTQFVSREFKDSGFCTPGKEPSKSNLGQGTMGEHLSLFPAKIPFDKNSSCEPICQVSHDKSSVKNIISTIMGSFKHEWIVDGIPILVCSNSASPSQCATHFYIGCTTKSDGSMGPRCHFSQDSTSNDYILFNHLVFTVTYRASPSNANVGEIMKVQVNPESAKKCDKQSSSDIYVSFSDETTELDISFYYSVTFVRDDSLSLNTRFDYIYENVEYGKVQWLSILVSLVLVILLTIVVAYLLVRAVRSDIMRYTELINAGFDTQYEYGWKLLKGDVFRAPKYRLLLAVSVGSGIQIVFMILFTLFFACIGFFTTYTRGSMLTCLIVLYLLLGILSGFVSARIYKFFDGEYWKTCVLATALLHPGIIFINLLLINFVVKSASSFSISFLTLFELFAFWVFVSIPLTFAGALYGFKRRAIRSPVKRNIIPRSIPKQPVHLRPLPCILIGGFLCFLCICLQLYFIVRSIWLRLSFVMFGLLFCVGILLAIVCGEVAIVSCYLHLCSEDYRWQWRSFLTGAATALYCLVYLFVYHSRLNFITNLGSFVFFGYSIVILHMLSLATGAIAFISTFYVLLRMFFSIKVD